LQRQELEQAHTTNGLSAAFTKDGEKRDPTGVASRNCKKEKWRSLI